MLSDVVELMNHDRAVFVTRFGETPEVWDHGIVTVAEVAPGEDSGTVYGDRLTHDHRSSSARAFGVVTEVPVTW
jgi:hypothetical protein